MKFDTPVSCPVCHHSRTDHYINSLTVVHCNKCTSECGVGDAVIVRFTREGDYKGVSETWGGLTT